MLMFGFVFLSPPDFDANNIFKAFFGGPGGFSFEGNLCPICMKEDAFFFLRIPHLFIDSFVVLFQHLDQEISSSSLVNWRTSLPKQHQDFSTMSTPQPTIHI